MNNIKRIFSPGQVVFHLCYGRCIVQEIYTKRKENLAKIFDHRGESLIVYTEYLYHLNNKQPISGEEWILGVKELNGFKVGEKITHYLYHNTKFKDFKIIRFYPSSLNFYYPQVVIEDPIDKEPTLENLSRIKKVRKNGKGFYTDSGRPSSININDELRNIWNGVIAENQLPLKRTWKALSINTKTKNFLSQSKIKSTYLKKILAGYEDLDCEEYENFLFIKNLAKIIKQINIGVNGSIHFG
tara:strand:- start:184 stop:909 length:726 start_codon:yes stop_codon:yes gene_type:complete